jgi:hypothetical protein
MPQGELVDPTIEEEDLIDLPAMSIEILDAPLGQLLAYYASS